MSNKTIRIDSKIVGYEVVKPEQAAVVDTGPAPQEIELMHEKVLRPEALEGSTYKIKTPLSEHALYVTINDIVLNQGTEHEQRHPFEIFINSKNMDHFQWIVALTRIASAVFRKGGDCTFLAEELKAVFDPKGGYFKKGGKFMPSLVAEIGDVIEIHLRKIGLIDSERLDEHQKAFIEQKKAELKADAASPDSGYPPGAALCGKCHTMALVQLDGCLTCLNCGDSKCG
ncbi:TSCPD domain-containing protein [Phytopseudomonas dryadis]|uniref:ribonucleoside-diphosphate reductase n=1 Tax=Phytopseudomonas dryadis TaxID=2487520 RepID=A0ABY1Z1E4_9GAMM|nr:MULTISPECIES: NrdJb [Pseudomonas]TBV00497.1 NrdJb [Pseudomonas dryadis]TBV13129.1 NrdJb [Pseudomonas sp. FRB 230]